MEKCKCGECPFLDFEDSCGNGWCKIKDVETNCECECKLDEHLSIGQAALIAGEQLDYFINYIKGRPDKAPIPQYVLDLASEVARGFTEDYGK